MERKIKGSLCIKQKSKINAGNNGVIMEMPIIIVCFNSIFSLIFWLCGARKRRKFIECWVRYMGRAIQIFPGFAVTAY